MAALYRLIAQVAYRLGWDRLAEFGARNYRRLTGQSAFDDDGGRRG